MVGPAFNKIPLTVLCAIVVVCFGRLALHGTGHENEYYRYVIPFFVGSASGYLIGTMKSRWLATNEDLWKANRILEEKVREVKTLKGIIPICAHCKNIRNDKGAWSKLEQYIHDNSEAELSHSICPECIEKHYPGYSNGNDEKC